VPCCWRARPWVRMMEQEVPKCADGSGAQWRCSGVERHHEAAGDAGKK
jgi:hypothetical protein